MTRLSTESFDAAAWHRQGAAALAVKEAGSGVFNDFSKNVLSVPRKCDSREICPCARGMS